MAYSTEIPAPNKYRIPERRFILYTEAHVADPAWVCPLVELFDDRDPVMYTDTSELEKLIAEMKRKAAHNAGYSEGVDYVLTSLGMTFPDFLKKRNEMSEVKVNG